VGCGRSRRHARFVAPLALVVGEDGARAHAATAVVGVALILVVVLYRAFVPQPGG